jgi:hypothetical protein
VSIAAPPPRFSPPPLRAAREVFILGAGFSKAISDQMPTLDELGHRIAGPFAKTPSFVLLPPAAKAAVSAGRLPGGTLEAWLSHLATAAPFLDTSEQLHNSAIAQELVKLLVDEIERSEAVALSAAMPYWLRRLVALWDRLDAKVITFNYDTLLEQAVNASEMPWIDWQGFSAEPVGAVAVNPLKMHGSTNWWWIPGDRGLFAVQPTPLAGRWGQPQPSLPVPGMERFIVPPLASKSDYYDLSFTRQDWMAAREALQGASRVVLMGYSAPATDLTVASLLSNYADPDTPVVVVDNAPDDIVSRLHQVGLRKAAPFQGPDPIRQFAEAYEREISQTVASSLLAFLAEPNLTPDDPVIARVVPSWESRLFVTAIRTEGEVTVIEAVDFQPNEVPLDRALKIQHLRQPIEEAAMAGRGLVLAVQGQPRRAVLNLAHRTFFGNWLAVEA